MSAPALPLSPANIDPGQVYLYRSANTMFQAILEQKVRVIVRGQAAILCEVLERRVYRSTTPPPDWTPVSPGLPKRLPLHHDVDAVSIWEV
jgi:hypothetical protein